jgi:hypothetical protein
MPDAAEIAREKIKALKAQLIELEQFLLVHDRLVGASNAASSAVLAPSDPRSQKDEGNITPQIKIPISVDNRKVRRRVGRPGDVAEHMERIIRDVGRPMTRGEIVAAFEARDIPIPFEDKARYVGTIAWRHKGTFVNIEGEGYWLRDGPPPQARLSGPSYNDDLA